MPDYVSRAGDKLAGANQQFKIGFKGKTVLDVGSSTGGFTDYALRHGAAKVVAVEKGTEQMHPKLRTDERVELHEKTDIVGFKPADNPKIVLVDVSFTSLRPILSYLSRIPDPATDFIVLLKPQFEAQKGQLNRGVIKNDRIRREVIKDFETWVQKLFIIIDKHDSDIAGLHGNQERFYHLRIAAR